MAHYQNKIKMKTCPICGDSRPLDWYGPEQKLIFRNKDSTIQRIIRYRKYLACWKCRAIRRIHTLSPIPINDEVER